MSVTTATHLIEPPGGKLVDRTGPRPDGVERLEQLELTSRELSDLDMLASGALSPLEGFMAQHDYERVVDEMREPTAESILERMASLSAGPRQAQG